METKRKLIRLNLDLTSQSSFSRVYLTNKKAKTGLDFKEVPNKTIIFDLNPLYNAVVYNFIFPST